MKQGGQCHIASSVWARYRAAIAFWCTLLVAVLLCGWQVYRGRHLHRDVAVKVLPLDGGLAKAVQREVQQNKFNAFS